MTNHAEQPSWLTAVDEQLRAAAKMLLDTERVDTTEDLLYFFEKPWKWTAEIAIWQDSGRPTVDDPTWPLFTHRLNRHTGWV